MIRSRGKPKPFIGSKWKTYGENRSIERLDAGLMRTLSRPEPIKEMRK